MTRIQELLAERDCRVSYTSLHRFVARRHWQRRRANTVRMGESVPGEVAELDFGRLGFIHDPETGRRCAVWALIVVLAHSWHSFVWPTYSQKLEEVIAGLEAAWTFFGGIPKYLVIDNFPAAVAGADSLHPRLTRASWNTPSTGASSPIRPGCAIHGTSPRWPKPWMWPRAPYFGSSGASPKRGWPGCLTTGSKPTGTGSWTTGAKPTSSR